jgi:predicted RNase H-like nuclease
LKICKKQILSFPKMTKHILGVDAAWTANGSSGLCLMQLEKGSKPAVLQLARSYQEFQEGEIKWNEKATASAPRLDEIIRQIGRTPEVVALDIPLSPAPITGYREADRQIARRYSRMGAAVHSPTKDRPGKIAEMLYHQLTASGVSWAGVGAKPDQPYFMEVYPHVTIIELLQLDYRLPYKVQKKGQYWKEATAEERYRKSIRQLKFLKKGIETELQNPLDEFLPELQESEKYTIHFLKSYEDLLDAIICALSGFYFLTEKAEGLGDQTSAIWVPKLNQ